MVALTGIATVALSFSTEGVLAGDWKQISIMILSSSCATIFVLGLLHSDLQEYHGRLWKREWLAQIEARRDGLTALRNRKALYEDLERIVADGSAQGSSFLSIIDLDHFKNVNDTMGHGVGDELLKLVAERISNAVSSTGRVYRLGGDEFAILLFGTTAEQALELCRHVCEQVANDYSIGGTWTSVGCSIGISDVESDLTVSEVMRRSDLAMYEAKSSRTGAKFFDNTMAKELERKTQLAVRLRIALAEERGISTKFQPIFDTRMGLVALEGLFRWRDDKYGAVTAQEAICVARDNRLLDKISLFVIRNACSQAQEVSNLKLCFNLEAVQLLDAKFMEEFRELMSDTSIIPERIQLEFSERDLIDYWDKIGPAIRQLDDDGFLIAVDDFGSGNASLTQLANLGVSEVKFDPSVLRFARESGNIAVIKAKTSLAHSLGMTVTCKGISSEEEESVARQSGCDFLQGFRMGRPHALGVFTNQPKALNAFAA